MTARISVGTAELLIMLTHTLGTFQLKLRNELPVGTAHLAVGIPCHMQYDRVVSSILVMPVMIPVRRVAVHFHIPHPESTIYLYFRIEEIGACIRVPQSAIDNFKRFTIWWSAAFAMEKFYAFHTY
jgi:hypothetical protein